MLAAATTLFADRGWAATGMRDIATEAGVAVETVYANFASKSDVLLAAIDAGVVGDTRSVPLSHRPEFAALAVGSLADRVAVAARLLTGINQRTWGLRRALTEAAGGEPQLAAKAAGAPVPAPRQHPGGVGADDRPSRRRGRGGRPCG